MINTKDFSGKMRSFRDHLRVSSKIVSTWPEWKQNILGGNMTLAEPEMCKECALRLKWKEDQKKRDLERFIELFDSIGIRYTISVDWLDEMTYLNTNSYEFIFCKTGDFCDALNNP